MEIENVANGIFQQSSFLKSSGAKEQLTLVREKNVDVWDIDSQQKTKSWKWPEWFTPLSDVKNSSVLLTSGDDIVLYDLRKDRVQWKRTVKRYSSDKVFALSNDGNLALVESDDSEQIEIWDTANGKTLRTRPLVWRNPTYPLQFSKSGKHLVFAHLTGVKILDARTGRKIVSRRLPKFSQPFAFALSPYENWLYTLEQNGDLKKWRVQ